VYWIHFLPLNQHLTDSKQANRQRKKEDTMCEATDTHVSNNFNHERSTRKEDGRRQDVAMKTRQTDSAENSARNKVDNGSIKTQ